MKPTLVWLIGAVVCLQAAKCGSSCLLMQAMGGCFVHCSIISSCHLPIDCKYCGYESNLCEKHYNKYQIFAFIYTLDAFAFVFTSTYQTDVLYVACIQHSHILNCWVFRLCWFEFVVDLWLLIILVILLLSIFSLFSSISPSTLCLKNTVPLLFFE